MNRRYELSDAEYQGIEHLLPGCAGSRSRPAGDNRRFINGVLWIARSGSAWHDLPERYGRWNTVYQRFHRWVQADR